MNWYLAPWKKYFDLSGRARRREYWLFLLGNIIISIILGIIDGILGFGSDGGVGILSTIFSLAIIIPSISVSVRRLHDIGRSGWWIFISLIPVIGIFVLLYFHVLDSQAGKNAYGENPKAA